MEHIKLSLLDRIKNRFNPKRGGIYDYIRVEDPLNVSIFDRIRYWFRIRNHNFMIWVYRIQKKIYPKSSFCNYIRAHDIAKNCGKKINYASSCIMSNGVSPYEHFDRLDLNTFQIRLKTSKDQRFTCNMNHTRASQDTQPLPEPCIEFSAVIDFSKMTPFLRYILEYFNPDCTISRNGKHVTNVLPTGCIRFDESWIKYFKITGKNHTRYTLDIRLYDALRTYVETDKNGETFVIIDLARRKVSNQAFLLCMQVYDEIHAYEYHTRTKKYTTRHGGYQEFTQPQHSTNLSF